MAKRSVEKYDFKAFGQAIKAARTERKESRKKVSDEMYIMGKCGCFLSCTYIRIVFCLSMSGKVGHNIAIRTSQLYRLSIRQNYLFLTQGLAQLVLHTYRLLIPLYTAQSHRRTSSSSRRGSLPSEASRPRFQCSHHQAE